MYIITSIYHSQKTFYYLLIAGSPSISCCSYSGKASGTEKQVGRNGFFFFLSDNL